MPPLKLLGDLLVYNLYSNLVDVVCAFSKLKIRFNVLVRPPISIVVANIQGIREKIYIRHGILDIARA